MNSIELIIVSVFESEIERMKITSGREDIETKIVLRWMKNRIKILKNKN